MDRTPKFNAEIDKILKNLAPYSDKCSQCNELFYIDDSEIEVFKKFRVPPPLMCFHCRRQNRYAFANYTTLFKRDCDVLDHNEKIISSIPEGTIFPVYDSSYYYGVERDHYSNSLNFDLSKTFFKQFGELFLNSPEPSLIKDPANLNSDYVSYGSQLKDCYYVFGGMNAENTMFGIWPMGTKNSLDILIAVNTDLSYEGVYPENCYNCNFVYFSNDCLDCSFIHDCRNCQNCFGCVNLRNKKYCIWNVQYNKEDYEHMIKQIDLGDRNELLKIKNKFDFFVKSLPVRATRNEHSKNVVGNYIINSKDVFNSMWVMHCENLHYTDFSLKVRDSYDCSISANTEKMFETTAVGSVSYNVKYCSSGRDLRDCEYLINCRNCQNCFGCIGLDNAKFCIFNKRYDEEEYWRIVDIIKVKMLEDGEYGKFFPLSMSPFPYNASLSNIIYPILKDKVLELGGWWYDEKNNLPSGMEIFPLNKINPNIKNITDNIMDIGLISESTGKPFRIVRNELTFYHNKNISIPSVTPYERIIERFKYVNNFKVFKDKCFNCGVEILSSYSSSEGFKPYCDDCYKKEIY